MTRPLAIDLFTGMHGWSEGLVAEGWRVVGFDVENMCGQFGLPRPDHVQLVIQNVLTLHGSQFKHADLIVASPPCQFFAYCAMPWSKAKALAAEVRADVARIEKELALFDACFRLQREACEAAGRHIPMVVENVKGAQPWVGRSRWAFGSFHLWGDVPALMPPIVKLERKVKMASWRHPDDPRHVPGQGFNTLAERATKNSGGSWFNIAHGKPAAGNNGRDGRKTDGAPHIRDGEPHTKHLTNPGEHGRKGGGGTWFHEYGPGQGTRNTGSGSKARKHASAMIAKIPLPLSRHIGRTFLPSIDS